ncbi:UDP-N-acetylmuramoyl-L-alanyl-D-glutamate--2,6-diaminopimelate ligase [Flavihumibacter sp. CACIAM 22H1]|uniref:UDP-N-acetylmuramoyl-L-alanyl-D-glutamate--2, 6-diaminopimelate ligase n=1 Tax=Flavihumibacter sp. CACIAM 22H1 TaxID=1812911 RepID=UPI0007A7FCFE|nr:UDP-N-acetylmuramoyl-L-alanyl-D-glutamate--2,6-diaminopimelate ligase [Flavihumibacter sp. CACIAM 22H1]KYP16516.1 MAG: UDP-N-acetylmuramoyl-L-alanyl-D-glutamate--2,6-diaminopimelate ligase [Flavihumibacter sp. CACIAM 22H1]
MASLQDILYNVSIRAVNGNLQAEVKDLQIDSRKVQQHSCFIAIRGLQSDGHLFIEKAIQAGASFIVAEELPDNLPDGITYVEVSDSSVAAGVMAANFFGQPSRHMKLVGVTGTNGKTTVATLLYKLFTALGYDCGLISTVKNLVAGEVLEATHTTPDAIQLQALLRRMADKGCRYAFMEVSSHAIHQNRIAGIEFAGGIFTNITHDHLDYHKTFDEYIRVKKKFFDELPAAAFAISNLDDKRGSVMLQNTAAKKMYYSLRSMAEFKGKILENGLTGLLMNINEQEVHFRLIGEFNAYNLLAVYGAALSLGEEKQEVLQALSEQTGAEGRFDYQVSPVEKIIGIVDYAHTPDALMNVLKTIRQLRQGGEQLIAVVGCGGDRDKTKRPVMGQVACELSDRAIFTSDNPRSEDPEAILRDMESELNSAAKRKFLSITDRRQAIKTAFSMAGPGDIILVAGKGHEAYQEIKGVKHHFDDKEEIEQIIKELGK